MAADSIFNLAPVDRKQACPDRLLESALLCDTPDSIPYQDKSFSEKIYGIAHQASDLWQKSPPTSQAVMAGTLVLGGILLANKGLPKLGLATQWTDDAAIGAFRLKNAAPNTISRILPNVMRFEKDSSAAVARKVVSETSVGWQRPQNVNSFKEVPRWLTDVNGMWVEGVKIQRFAKGGEISLTMTKQNWGATIEGLNADTAILSSSRYYRGRPFTPTVYDFHHGRVAIKEGVKGPFKVVIERLDGYRVNLPIDPQRFQIHTFNFGN